MTYTATFLLLFRKRLLFIVAFLFVTFQAYSQKQDTTSVPDLETDRPDQTESASVVPRKSIQIEAGLYFQKDKAGATDIKYVAHPSALMRFGVLSWLELRAEGTYQTVTIEEESRKKLNGFGPLTVGAKAKLWDENGLRPQTALMTMFDLPVGHNAFAPANPEVNLRLLFKNSLSEKVDLSYNLAYGWEDGEAVKSYTVSLATELSDKIGVFGEVFGDKTNGEKATHSFDAGFTVLVLPNLQVDLAAGTAISSSSPEYFVTTGFSVRLPR
ncbi:transporter [Pontibacter sp. BT310]|uniref:Transporter n=1 Tax=Pontibacter populi TaxID=890055 RepID=A0ABS6XCX5_9BACT|nr:MULTISPECIES: transporter [Pontibacter]MBJ6118974.1 transporter [Pontibacter sp. BT310]MBR0571402.1 transporter [Microvirga sp. STS03]MBW3365828.1 transporter [Pontibacter populi]